MYMMHTEQANGPAAAAFRTRQGRIPPRRSIIAAARCLLREQSYGELGLEDVAREAGVSRRTIYNQFMDKADLYRATRDAIMSELSQLLPQSIDNQRELDAALCEFAEQAVAALSSQANSDLVSSLMRDRHKEAWLGTAYERQVIEPLRRTVEVYLYAQQHKGELSCEDVAAAANGFVNLIQTVASPVPVSGETIGMAKLPPNTVEAIVDCFLQQYRDGVN